MICPERLTPGDVIGIVSPSWGGAGMLPQRTAQGVKQLEAFGYRVKFARHALNHCGYVSDTAIHRTDDLHELFGDPEVKAIIAAIGGDHSCHLLPWLDFELIRRSPKIFMGFSDNSVLNLAIYQQTGLVTFNGPALLTDFAEYPSMFEYTRASLLNVLTQPQPAGVLAAAPAWTEEFLDWGTQKDRERPRIMQKSTGWTWLKTGNAQGPLIGGCIDSLQHLRGTRFWPDWHGAIFFWETSEEKPGPETIDGILMDYENMGVLGKIQGMVVGRPMKYSDDEKQALREILLERTRQYSFPIITDMDFGHTSPQMTLPIGIQARIDTQVQVFELCQAAVS